MAGYLFEWDPAKADQNWREHGVGFDEAITTFSDPFSVHLPDPDHSRGEQRYLVLGSRIRAACWWGDVPLSVES